MGSAPKKSTSSKAGSAKAGPAKSVEAEAAPQGRWRRLWFWTKRALAGFGGLVLALTLIYAFVPVSTTLYMIGERIRLGGIERDWVGGDDIAPVMFRSVVAAEDANFCLHWGFDMAAIRDAVDRGANRGASTLSQQTVKNVFLWQGRSWVRKALEASITPVVELIWTKRRILVVYLNIAEFGEGIFGVEAAAQHYFGVSAAELSAVQAARLAAVLPDPKRWNPAKPTSYLRRRANSIVDGAATIQVDGRASCFEPRAASKD